MCPTRKALAVLVTILGLTLGLIPGVHAGDNFASDGPGTSGEEKVIGVLTIESRDDRSRSGTSRQASQDMKAGVGCSIQCITTGVAYAVGVGAHLKVTTDTPAQILINVIGEGNAKGSGNNTVTSFGATWPSLQPGTTYKAEVWATDSQGYTSYASGHFDTLRRFATVDFGAHFCLTSYPSAYDGKMHAYYRAGVQTEYQVSELHWGSDCMFATLPGARAEHIGEAPEVLTPDVLVLKDKKAKEECEGWHPHDLPDGGTSNCKAWARAYAGFVALDQYPANATSWTSHDILTHAHTQAGAPVQFTAPITINVWYDE